MSILVNMLLKSVENDCIYRILWVDPENKNVRVFDCTTEIMPEFVNYEELKKQIADGFYEIQDIDRYIRVILEQDLSEKDKQIRDKAWEVMEPIVLSEPDVFVKKLRGQMLAQIIKESQIGTNSFYRYLKLYWKYGKSKNAFIPKYDNCGSPNKEHGCGDKKRGRPREYSDGAGVNVDEKMKKVFDSAIKKYYHTRNENTLQYAYDMMIKEHFTLFIPNHDGETKVELLSEDKIPTIGQFRYWYNKKHDIPEKIRKRKGDTKFELTQRALIGKSDFGIMGPGAKYQIDTTIGDIYLVSRFNRADIIGRPVIYFVIDVFSRMIAGMYVGLEGPSWAGSMMAIANACRDKVKYCAEYGITISREEWPCAGVPGAILGDRGEMESKSAEMMINALNIRVSNTPPYRGDLKGIIEQYFNVMNRTALSRLPGHVKPDMWERGGKDYRLDAKLDIYQLTQILIRCVLYHNNQHYHEVFERTEDMIAQDIRPIPLNVWNWGITHCSGALRTFPEETIKLYLCPADTATVTAKGIRSKSLYYICDRAVTEYWLETARAKGSWKVNISYDPRNMGKIYIREPDGSVDICKLTDWQEKYSGKYLDEIVKLRESEKRAKQEHQTKELASKADLSAAIDSVIAEAEDMARQTVVPKSKAERTRNIRDNRRVEKETNRLEEVFHIGEGDEKTGNAGNSDPNVSKADTKEEEEPCIADTRYDKAAVRRTAKRKVNTNLCEFIL